MVQEAGFIKLLSSLILKPFNMHSGIEKIEKENLDLFGLRVLMQAHEL